MPTNGHLLPAVQGVHESASVTDVEVEAMADLAPVVALKVPAGQTTGRTLDFSQ
jgi:hypothetical protein